MEVGKLNWDELKNLIDKSRGSERPEVRIKSGIGEDCSVINFGEYECAISSDPITGAEENSGRLAVHINCNDIAATGVEPLGIMITILAPETAEIADISRVMREVDEEAKKLNIEVLGGHTEVTRAVNKMVLSCTVIGKGKKDTAVATSGAKIGDDIIVTKELCIEGTYIAVSDYEEYLGDILSTEEIEEAKTYLEMISVVKEGVIAGKFGVNSMHDITEGGVLGALFEVAEASGKGFEAYYESMPINPIALKVCSGIQIDPLRLISSGSMLITCNNGGKLVELLNKNGIKASIIGKITEAGGYLYKEGTKDKVLPPKRDELFVMADKLKPLH
ncbi:MAG: AIR synthase family protein [Solirubrobacterales bacterium]